MRTIKIVLIVIGAVILLISLLADLLKIGPIGMVAGFGWRQIVGIIVGLILLALGILLKPKPQ